MKKNNFIFVTIALVMSFIACEKDGGDTINGFDPIDAPVLISRIIFTYESEGELRSKFESDHYYDSENKLETRYQWFQTYNNENNQDDRDTVHYYYNLNNQIIEIVQTGENNVYKEVYSYGNNVINSTYSYFNNFEYIESSKSELQTDENGKVVKIQSYYINDFTGEFELSGSFTTNEWSNGNKVKSISHQVTKDEISKLFGKHIESYILKSTNDTSISTVRTSEYTDKINASAYSSLQSLGNGSKNLPSSSQTISTDGIYSSSSVFSYIFGENGFPEKTIEVFELTINREGSEPIVYLDTYTTEFEYLEVK